VGDKVRMHREFLRSTGQYAGDIAHAIGTIEELKDFGQVKMAVVAWDLDIPRKVVTANLESAEGGTNV